MFVYLINIVLICVYALVFLRRKSANLKRNKIIFLVLCFVQCAVISAFRYDVGVDFIQYSNGFRKMAQSGFSNLTYYDWEIGYILLNKIIGLFTNNPTVLMAITTVMCLAGPFYLILRYSKNYFMSVFLFVNTFLFYLEMNFIRQGIAMSIMCFAYGFMKNCEIGKGKNLLKSLDFWLFILFTTVAATFHFAVFYLIPVLFVSFIKINWKTLPIYAVGLIIYYVFSDKVLKLVLSHFHQEYADSRFIKYGVSFKYAIIPLIICVAMVGLAFYLNFKMSRSLNLLMHLTLMMGFWQIVMTKHALFERFSYYTMIYIIIAIPEAIYAFKEKLLEDKKKKAEAIESQPETVTVQEKPHKKKLWGVKGTHSVADGGEKTVSRIIVAVNAAVCVLILAYNLYGLIVPINGAHGVLPYQSVFNVNIPNIDGWFKS